MPKITRQRVSVFASPAVRFGGAVFGVSGLFALGAIFLGMSDKGTIDVSGKIRATDQSGFSTQVSPTSNAAGINGGLNPMSPSDVPPVVEAPSAPVDEPATTTPEVSSEGEIPEVTEGETDESSTQVSDQAVVE